MKIQGKTILVTGGASGIGLALVKRFAARGATVIVCGRRPVALHAARQAVPGLVTLQADVAEEAERERLVDEVLKAHPTLDILVNNAGIQNHPGPVTEPQDWAAHAREIATNLEAPMHLSMLLAPHLVKRPEAAIMNVTSGLAFVPIARMPTYCATKAALHSFTLSLRHQLRATTVKVIEIAPPAVDTDLGGPGLHTFGEPVDAFGDHAIARIEAGDIEFGYKMSEGARTADRATLEQVFQRLNAG